MNIDSKPPEDTLVTAAPAPPAAPKAMRSNNQIGASAFADGLAVRAKWRTVVAEAKVNWEQIPLTDLQAVDGNFHRLAGLLQQRYQLDRESANVQARAFFDKHFPPH